MGRTETPVAPMRNGYSSVPCPEPRYLTMRMRRFEIWSLMRWSSRITQSDAYSSSPRRVSSTWPRSAVTIAVIPRSLIQENRREISKRRFALSEKRAKSASTLSSTSRRVPFLPTHHSSRARRPSSVKSPVSTVCSREISTDSRWSVPWASASLIPNEEDAKFCSMSARLSSNDTKVPGSPNSTAPRQTNSMASAVFPQPGPPQTSVGRPSGSPPLVIWSRPEIPVAAFGNPPRRGRARAARRSQRQAHRAG